MSRPTVVTCLFDLAGREPSIERPTVDQFIERGEFVLGLDADLICFAEPSVTPAIRATRDQRGLTKRSQIVTCPLEALDSHQLLGAATKTRHRNPLLDGRELDTPLYTVLQWSKFELLGKAMAFNPFGSGHFIWVDFGLGHAANTEHHAEDRVLTDSPDRVRLLQVEAFNRSLLKDRAHHLSYRRDHYADGLISGESGSLCELCTTVDQALHAALADGFAPTNQQLLELAVARRPTLFRFHYGDYDHIIENYRIPRGSAANLLHQLRHWRAAKNWKMAGTLAKQIIESVAAGTFVSEPAALASLLEECCIVSYYADDPDHTRARIAASLYLERASHDPEFRDEFLLHELRVRNNFSFV